jgi:hypothetical protein
LIIDIIDWLGCRICDIAVTALKILIIIFDIKPQATQITTTYISIGSEETTNTKKVKLKQ